MRTKIFFLYLVVCTISGVSNSPTIEKIVTTTESKDSIRLLYNPQFDNARDNVAIILNAGYRYKDVKSLTVGNQISGRFFFKDLRF